MKRYGGIISIALFIVLTAMFVAAAQQPLKKDTSIDLGKAFSCPVTGKTVAVSLGGNNGDSNALDSGPVIGYPMFEEQDIGGLYGCFSEVCFDDFVIETRDLYKQLLHFNRQILLDHVRPPADPFNPQALDVAAWQSFILEFFKGWIDPNVPVVFIDTHGGAEEMAVAGSWEIYDDKGDSVFGSKEEEQAFRDKAQAFADALVTSLKADDGPFYKEIISKLKDPPSNWKDLIYTGFTDEKIGGLPIVLFGAPIFWALPEKEFVMTQSCTGVGIPTARQVIGFDYCADIGAGNDIFNEILERLMGRRNKGNGRNTLEAVKDLDVFITPKTITFTAIKDIDKDQEILFNYKGSTTSKAPLWFEKVVK